MTKRFLPACLVVFGLPLFLCAQPDTILIDQYELEGVVISASKREASVMDVPVSVTLLSGLTLERDRIASSTDLTGPIPNLYMPDYGSRLTTPVYIRGIGSRINAPSVGFYMDEVALFEKAAHNLDLVDVERIEVLRGPQGTLYGRNTMGGIVHVITRDPQNSLGLRFSGELGTFGHQQYRLMVENPIVKERLFFQLSGNFRTRSGYHINQFDGKPVDRMNSGGGRLKLLYRPSEKSRIMFNLYGDLGDEGAYPYAVVPEDGADLVINYDHASSYRREMMGASLQYEYTGNRIRLNSITSFQDLKGFQDIDQDFTPAGLVTVTQDQDQQLVTQEIRISNAGKSDRIDWIAGAYGFFQADDQEVGVEYGEDGIAAFRLPYTTYAYNKQNDMTNRGAALFGQGSLRDLLLEGLELAAGIRIDYEKNALDYVYDRVINGETVPGEDFISGSSFLEILPKFSLNYRWTENQMNYVSITRGYKSGGFNTTFEREEDRSFRPEFSWNYEIGWKGSLAGDRANMRLALFYIDWEDLQVYQPIPSGRGSMLKNAASAYSRGLELEVNAMPVKNLRLTGNLGYSDVRFTDFKPDPEEELNHAGNRVPYVPDLTGFFSGSYRMPLNGGLFQDLVFTVNWRETGKIFWNDANEYSQDAYGLAGANISVGISQFNLGLWAENILDTGYRSFQFTALGNVYAQPGLPRRFGITLAYKL